MSRRARKQLIPAVLGGVSASAGMPAAPTGYHWDFVIFDGQWVTFDGQPVVALAANGD